MANLNNVLEVVIRQYVLDRLSESDLLGRTLWAANVLQNQVDTFGRSIGGKNSTSWDEGTALIEAISDSMLMESKMETNENTTFIADVLVASLQTARPVDTDVTPVQWGYPSK